jgi:hypothetical protein
MPSKIDAVILLYNYPSLQAIPKYDFKFLPSRVKKSSHDSSCLKALKPAVIFVDKRLWEAWEFYKVINGIIDVQL